MEEPDSVVFPSNLTEIINKTGVNTLLNVEQISQALQYFGWADYISFVGMLLICVAIGIYFGFINVVNTEAEYLVGGRNMKVFPISMSLIASFTSGISLLGIPTEMYVYGIQYLYILLGLIIMGIIFQYIYLPVFHHLKLTSTFEYLEKRFDRRVRLFGSLLCIIGNITWLPIVIYVPALAFNQVTGVNVHLVTPLVCLICIFYTSAGGLKAVVWTDVIQTIIMFGSMLLVAVKGTVDVGGVGVVWQRTLDSGRIEPPNFELNLLTRHTIWALVIGGFVYMLQASAVNQSMVQRYLALPTLNAANWAVWTFICGISTLILVCAYCGLLIYASYHNCDPITTELAKQKDQLLPLFVMDVIGGIPGLPGIFVAGIFSAALSSLSTGLNSLTAVLLEDFYRRLFKEELSERHIQIFMKSAVVVIGFIFVALVFVVENLGTVLQLVMSVGTISCGPSLSLFTMGLVLPWVNGTGALIGGVFGLVFMVWLALNAQTAIATGALTFETKPVSTDGCEYDFSPKTSTPFPIVTDGVNTTEITEPRDVFILFQLSYLWYTLLSLIVSISVGLLASLVNNPNDPRDLDPALLTPLVRSCITPRQYPNEPPGPDEIILAYDPKTYKIVTRSSNSLPKYNSDATAV